MARSNRRRPEPTGDDSFDRDKQPFETHYFQTGTTFPHVTVATGPATVTVWCGDTWAVGELGAILRALPTLHLRVFDVPEGRTRAAFRAELAARLEQLGYPPSVHNRDLERE